MASLLAWAIAPARASAAPEDMDTSFSGDGLVPTGVGIEGNDVAIDSEGRIVAAFSQSGNNAGVVRLLPSGAFDSSFSGDGIARYPGIQRATRVAVDSSDRVLFAGVTPIDVDTGAANVVRFTEAGALDNTFDGNGSRGLGDFEPTALQVRPDGRVLLGLTPFRVDLKFGGEEARSKIMQLTAAGAPDSTFGTGGTVNVDFAFPTADRSIIDDLALRPDGRAVGVARILSPGGGNVVIRLLANGAPDSSLNGGNPGQSGYAVLPSNWAAGKAVTSDSAGRIVLTGTIDTAEGQRAQLGRLNASGTADSSFGTGGLVVADPAPSADYPQDVAVAGDGMIWISGNSSNPDVPVHFLLARFLSNGAVDTSFSQDGNASAPIGTGMRMVLDSSQRVVMAGSGNGTPSFAPQSLLVVRYLRDGSGTNPPSPPQPPPGGGGSGGGGGTGGVAGVFSDPDVNVHRVIVPRSRAKLAKRGVRVLASCNQDCTIFVEVAVSRRIASAMGLPSTLIAQGFVLAGAGKRRWVRAKSFSSTVRRALRSFTGTARLRINVSATPPALP